MTPAAGARALFAVTVVDYADAVDALRAVREAVFIDEQHVPLELEWDALDPLCRHVLARDREGRPIGTGRLTPQHSIGRMSVLREWRGTGVGDALLHALLDQARALRWTEANLHAQVSAEGFYARHGFVAYGERFLEAGIEHQAMHRRLDRAQAIDGRQSAVVASVRLINDARRRLHVYSRALDPGLFDAARVLGALRAFAIRGQGNEVRILLQDADAPQRAHAPLLALAQRLPSAFVFRETTDPVDRGYPSAFIANDGGGYYFRPLGHRFEGESEPDAGGRARQLVEAFRPVWERSQPCSGLRALGL